MKETNMEHYRGEINRASYKFSKCNGKIIKECSSFICGDCDFSTLNNMENIMDSDDWRCTERKIKWLMSEYKPEPVLTQREKHFVEFLQTGYITRDENGESDWHEDEPYKNGNAWYSGSYIVKLCTFQARDLFPFITWEDEEPWSVESLRKLKVQE